MALEVFCTSSVTIGAFCIPEGVKQFTGIIASATVKFNKEAASSQDDAASLYTISALTRYFSQTSHRAHQEQAYS
jgi:hypothetical protein